MPGTIGSTPLLSNVPLPKQLFSNNAPKSALAAGIAPTDLTFSITTGHGARFANPSITTGDWELMTIAQNGNYEVVMAQQKTSDTFNVQRGQEGTTAIAFTAGAEVYGGVTKGTLEALRDTGAEATNHVAYLHPTANGLWTWNTETDKTLYLDCASASGTIVINNYYSNPSVPTSMLARRLLLVIDPSVNGTLGFNMWGSVGAVIPLDVYALGSTTNIGNTSGASVTFSTVAGVVQTWEGYFTYASETKQRGLLRQIG